MMDNRHLQSKDAGKQYIVETMTHIPLQSAGLCSSPSEVLDWAQWDQYCPL